MLKAFGVSNRSTAADGAAGAAREEGAKLARQIIDFIENMNVGVLAHWPGMLCIPRLAAAEDRES